MSDKRKYLIEIIDLYLPKLIIFLEELISFENPQCFYYISVILQIY